MTFVSDLSIPLPDIQQRLHPPKALDARDVSLIIPVKDNQRGLDALLRSIEQIHDPSCLPAEIIIVDNNSRHPLRVSASHRRRFALRILQCNQPGPASARNLGAQQALGCWLWFCDSDCLLSEQSLQGYREAFNGAIGYAGWIQSTHRGLIHQYYEDQQILIPPDIRVEGRRQGLVARPAYVITANALIYQPAFQMIGGLRSAFAFAAGEDIDFGIRLWTTGELSYAPGALVHHTFEPDVVSFLKRFIRYGRGNRQLSQMYQIDLTPRRFSPYSKNILHCALAQLQWAGLRIGYALER